MDDLPLNRSTAKVTILPMDIVRFDKISYFSTVKMPQEAIFRALRIVCSKFCGTALNLLFCLNMVFHILSARRSKYDDCAVFRHQNLDAIALWTGKDVTKSGTIYTTLQVSPKFEPLRILLTCSLWISVEYAFLSNLVSCPHALLPFSIRICNVR